MTDALERAFCEHAAAVGYLQARQLDLDQDESQVCALTFSTRMLALLRKEGVRLMDKADYSVWIHHCARNHAAQYQRAHERHGQHHVGLEAADAQITSAHWQVVQQMERALRQEEFWKVVDEAVLHLEPMPTAIFVAHYRDEATLAEIALSCGCSLAAVKQSLYRSRKRVAELLEQRGCNEVALLSLLAPGPDGSG